MKLVFSRKGFDSSAGGFPSPIINGKPISLPIPHSNSKVSYQHFDLGKIVKDLSKLEKDIELFYLEFSKINRVITNLIPLPFRQKTVEDEFINMINNF